MPRYLSTVRVINLGKTNAEIAVELGEERRVEGGWPYRETIKCTKGGAGEDDSMVEMVMCSTVNLLPT